jgi:ELWxxDGT repeat protein
VYFVADDGNLGFELWSSNGTAGGTELVVDAVPGVATNYWSAEQVVQSLQNSSDAYWYAAQFLNHDLVLEYNGDAYFTLFETAVGTNQLWKAVDGQRQFVANLRSSQYSVPLVGAPLNGELVFFEYAGGLQGYNVWRTDGTTEGTRFVKQINTAPTYSDPDFAVLDDLMYVASRQTFAGDNELWQVGVTAEDTRLVADLAPGEASSFPAAFTVHHGLLYFVATNPESTNLALWRSDGTASGTMPLVTNSGATYTRFIRSIDSSASGLYYVQSESFGRDRTDRQQELWYTDGTPGGEVLLRSEYAADFADHSIQVLASTDAGVYFRAGDASLWFATPQGVERVSEVAVCGVEYSSCEAVMWNDWLYFPGDDGQHGMELWRSNGTPTGTEMVADISAGTPSSYPAELTIVGDSLYFTADDKIHGPELWRFVESLPGDANFDGVVDAIDLEIWSENAMSVGASASRGDFNSDGVVDVRDFNVWLAHRFTSAKANEAASTVSRTPRAASHDARDVGATAEVELLSTHNLSSQWRMVTATTDEPRRQSSDNIAGRTIISYRSMHNSIQRRRGGMSLDMALSPSQTEPAEVPLTTQPIDDVFASQQWQ